MAKGSPAQEQKARKTVAKIFADIVDPPVFVDMLREVKVFQVKQTGGTKVKGAQVNFAKEEFVEANGGEMFEFDIETTDELDLQRVLAPRPGIYQVQGYDREGLMLSRAARYVIVEAENPDEIDDDDDDDDDDDGVPQQPGSPDAAMAKLMFKMMDRMQARADRAKNSKEEPNVMVEMLRDELRSIKNGYEDQIRELKAAHLNEVRELRTKLEDQIRNMQSKHDTEVQQIWLETKTAIQGANNKLDEERKEFNADRRDWQNEIRTLTANYEAQLRALRDSKESELRSLRDTKDAELRQAHFTHEGKVQELQSRIIILQQESNSRLLEEQKNSIRLDLDRQLALRDAADSQNVAATIRMQAEQERQQMTEQVKAMSTQSAGTAGAIVNALPHVKDLISMWRSSEKALPAGGGGQAGPMDIQGLLNMVASNPALLQQLRDPAIANQIQDLLGTRPVPVPTPTPNTSWDPPAPAPQPAPAPAADPWGPGTNVWGATPAPAAAAPAPAAAAPAPAAVVEPTPVAAAPAPEPVSPADPEKNEPLSSSEIVAAE